MINMFMSQFALLSILVSSCVCCASVSNKHKYYPPRLNLGGDLKTWIHALVVGLPGNATEAYSTPTDDELTAFRAAAENFANENWEAANSKANEVNYDVVEIEDISQRRIFGLLPSSTNTDGRGYFLLRRTGDWDIDVVIESPHSVFDQAGSVSAEVFQDSEARGFMMAGTHRCSSTSYTTCTGRSFVCTNYGHTEGYRVSDMAHVTNSFFQVFHEVMSLHSASTTAVQMHGFRSPDENAEFIASVGLKEDFEGALSNNLTDILDVKIRAANSTKVGRSCNRPEVGWPRKRLCATWNPQGRWSNGVRAVSGNDTACTAFATENSNRFVHLEISKNETRTITPKHVTDTLKQLFKK